MIESELAKYGLGGVAIGSLIVLVIIVKYFIDKNKSERAEMLRCASKEREDFLKFAQAMMKQSGGRQEKLRIAIEKNTKVNNEVYEFLKNLNGSLKKAIESKLN